MPRLAVRALLAVAIAGAPPEFDCEWRRHAWEFAKTTLPERGAFRTAYDALALAKCGVPQPADVDRYRAPRLPLPQGVPRSKTWYVDPAAKPGGDGSKAAAFNTLEAGVAAAGAVGPGPKALLLRAGTHRTAGVVLTPAHSGLVIQNDDGAEAVVSGAVPVPVSQSAWSVHNASSRTYKLDLQEHWHALPKESFGMRVGTQRATRAKYPNGNPEGSASHCPARLAKPWGPCNYTSVFDDTMLKYYPREHDPVASQYWARPEDWPEVRGWLRKPQDGWPAGYPVQGHSSVGGFVMGLGGNCSGRGIPFGYWCAPDCPRAKAGQTAYNPPGGVYYKHSPLERVARYSNPRGAVFHAIAGSFDIPFYSVQCLVTAVHRANGTVSFDHKIGCDQGATWNAGADEMQWYIENVKEECDSPGEYFLDTGEQALYYTFNATEVPATGREEFFLTTTKVLFNISGSQRDPVKNLSIRGLVIRDAALTYLGTTEADLHWMPSDGDWGLARSGAVLAEGTEGFTFSQNLVTRCDGIGVFLNGYQRDAVLARNEFSWMGESAMAAFGSSSRCVNSNCSVRLPANIGPDARGGNMPLGTVVAGNLVREVGIFQKQSVAWQQAITGGTVFKSNVVFNMPHTAWHANDGAYGGDELVGNLLFNVNRETTAHGVINSYERQPYINDRGMVRNEESARTPTVAELDAGATPGYKLAARGTATVISRYRRVHRNFFVANYYSTGPYYTDDGTSRVLMYLNYNVLGNQTMSPHYSSEWIYNVGCVNAYQGELMDDSKARWKLFFYNTTILTGSPTGTWCSVHSSTLPADAASNATFRNLTVYTPGGVAAGNQACTADRHADQHITVKETPSMATLRAMATATMAPFPTPFVDPRP